MEGERFDVSDAQVGTYNIPGFSPDTELVDADDNDLNLNIDSIITTVNKRVRSSRKSTFAWRDEVVFQLINMWKLEPVMFNVKDPGYSSKDKRAAALVRLVDGLKDEGVDPLPTTTDVQEKLNSLRVYFNVQKNKVSSSKGTGTGTSAVFKPTWKFYNELEFLKDIVTPRRTYSNLHSTEDDFLFTTSTSSTGESRRSKKHSPNPATGLIQEATSVLRSLQRKENIPPNQQQQNPTKSSDDFFGESIGKLMAEIPDGMGKDMLKLEIQKLIYKTKYNPIPQPQQFPVYSGSSSAATPSHRHSTPFHVQQTQAPPCGTPFIPQPQSQQSPLTPTSSQGAYNVPCTPPITRYADIYGSPVYQPNIQ